MAFVRARLYLDTCTGGTEVIIHYDDVPENRTLVNSIKQLGHDVIDSDQDFTSNDESDNSVALKVLVKL